MILAGGKVYDSAEQSRILSELPERINETREHRKLSCAAVIDALDRMSRRIAEGAFDALLEDKQLRSQVQYAAQQLSREALSYKVRTELGEDWEAPVKAGNIIVQTMPLGVILHVAAGNMDALPAWSVIEGLLAGNINLLKLPQADKGLTIQFFQMLLAESPELRDFIYVFDTPSADIAGTPAKSDLSELAEHILQTRQLLCRSCQVIYMDTEDMAEIHHFCEAFLPYLENAAAQFPVTEPGAAAFAGEPHDGEYPLRRYTRIVTRAFFPQE